MFMLSCRADEWVEEVVWQEVAAAVVADMRHAKIGGNAAVLDTIRRGPADATMDMRHIIKILVTNIRFGFNLIIFAPSLQRRLW